jgi:hypothetical protein
VVMIASSSDIGARIDGASAILPYEWVGKSTASALLTDVLPQFSCEVTWTSEGVSSIDP